MSFWSFGFSVRASFKILQSLRVCFWFYTFSLKQSVLLVIVLVLFSHMASGWVDGWAVEKGLSLSCISEAVRYRKLVLCRDIG